MPHASKLNIEDVEFRVQHDSMGFALTSELPPLSEIIGQPRALEALDLGVGVGHQDYHVFAAGMTGTGKLELLRRALEERTDTTVVPGDWLYVNNFSEPDRPLAISLPAGQGVAFRDAMQKLIERLVEAIPKAFREEDFSREKDRLRDQYRQRGEQLFQELQQLAQTHSLSVRRLSEGELVFLPLKDGRPMTPEEVEKLTPEEMAELEKHQQELIEKAAHVLEQQQEIQADLISDVREVAREFARRLIEPMIAAIAKQFPDDKLTAWLHDLERDIIDHLDRFRLDERLPKEKLAALLEGHDVYQQKPFMDYQVNVIVDNSDRDRPPVIIETSPNYRNLFGTIERLVDRFGRVTTNFTRIKAGSLLKANGGFLVFDLIDAVSEPFVWKELKRTLKAGSIELDVYDPFSMFTVSAVKPEAIPLNVKLAAAGPPLVYHLLCLYDEDFSRVFRVKADFDDRIERDQHAGRVYGQFVRKLSDDEQTRPFTADGIEALLRVGARLTGARYRLSTEFTYIADVVREADYWARLAGAESVTGEHVRIAGEKRVFRSDLIAARIRELIHQGTILIELDTPAVGQINGLAVVNLGDYAFGRPSRVSARVGVGAAGLINIERESRLSGATYDKAILILEGFLRGHYAQERPLSLSASIAMEQSYGGIDGDSASVAELLCLLSALADVPLRQDIAVTGSINQHGQVQAIGGVNEKVEGFYDVCATEGLTGAQGVCIPKSNVRHVVLRPDVEQAVRDGKFHLWAVDHIDQAIELFTGLEAGGVDDEQSVHGRVNVKLRTMGESLKERSAHTDQRIVLTPGAPEAPPDPRPPLPGRDD